MTQSNQDETPPRAKVDPFLTTSPGDFVADKLPIFWGPNQYITEDDTYVAPQTWRNWESLRVPRVVRFFYENYIYDESKEKPLQGGPGGDGGGGGGVPPDQCNASVIPGPYLYQMTFDGVSNQIVYIREVYYGGELTGMPGCPVVPFEPQSSDTRVLHGYPTNWPPFGWELDHTDTSPYTFYVPTSFCIRDAVNIPEIHEYYKIKVARVWHCKNRHCVEFDYTIRFGSPEGFLFVQDNVIYFNDGLGNIATVG
jgi:hypothetical protein